MDCYAKVPTKVNSQTFTHVLQQQQWSLCGAGMCTAVEGNAGTTPHTATTDWFRVPGDFAGTTAGNRRYLNGAMEGLIVFFRHPMLLSLHFFYVQATESGIPPPFRVTVRYSRIHLGF